MPPSILGSAPSFADDNNKILIQLLMWSLRQLGGSIALNIEDQLKVMDEDLSHLEMFKTQGDSILVIRVKDATE